jgi:Tfp pilus assembly protein PilO
MQTHRVLSGATIFLMLVLVVAGWFLVAQPQLAAASTASDQLTSARAQMATTEGVIRQLKAQQKGLPKLKAELASLRQSIPEGAESSALIDGINALAAATGVTINSLSLADAVAYTPPVVVATPSTTSTTATPSAPATAAPAATVAPSAWNPTSDPSITAANFVVIPVSITSSGDWSATLAFIHGLQSGTRLFLVSGFNTAQSADATAIVTTKTSGYIYALLDPKADALAASTSTTTPTATTPTATTSPSGSATPTPTQSPTPTKKP